MVWYGKFKNNEKDLLPNFAAEVQKEQTWLALLFKKLQDERQPGWVARQKVRGLFSGPPSNTSCLQRAVSLHEERVTIKREREESVAAKAFKTARAWSMELRNSKSTIDLDADDDHDDDDDDDDDVPCDSPSIEAAIEEAMDQMEEEEQIDFGTPP